MTLVLPALQVPPDLVAIQGLQLLAQRDSSDPQDLLEILGLQVQREYLAHLDLQALVVRSGQQAIQVLLG